MKKLDTLILTMVIFMSSCGITTKDFYEYNNWAGTDKVEKVIKKKEKIRKLIIWNYTSTYFPNETIEELINLKALSVGSDSSYYDSNLDDYLEFDANKLSKIKNLKTLNLGTFSMDSFPSQLANTNLEELNLSIDKLESLNTDFSNLDRMKKMSIIMSDLKYIGGQTKFPESLTQLILYSKNLQSISLDAFKNSEIEKIYLWASDLSDENLINLIKSLEKVKSLNKLIIYLNKCERKKYLSATINSVIKIKYKTPESCYKIF